MKKNSKKKPETFLELSAEDKKKLMKKVIHKASEDQRRVLNSA